MDHQQRPQENDEVLRWRALELLFSQNNNATGGGFLCLAIVSWAFWSQVPISLLVIWALFYIPIVHHRAQRITQYASNKDRTTAGLMLWHWRVDVLQLTTGLMWGGLLGYLALIGYPNQVVIVILIMAALVSGGLSAFSFRQKTYRLFSSAMCLPVVVCLALREDPFMIASILTLAWYLFLLSCSKKFYEFFVSSVELYLTNRDLATDLEQRNQEVGDLNRSLHKKVSELGQTNNTLVSEQERIKAFAEELERLSTTDPLTHIANRRYFESALDKAWQRALRSGREVALIMLDVDHFKAYNDNYGHQAGDNCLVNVAQILSNSANPENCVARYGGEEFVILLPHTSHFVALEEARNYVGRIEDARILHEHSPVAGHITLSAGLSVIRPDSLSSPKLLMENADKALYHAKHSGRNQVISDRAQGVLDATERSAVQLDDVWHDPDPDSDSNPRLSSLDRH